ncbi:MAG: glk [Nevskia sp.]|nr:glk [Nevskia sp.]
MTAARRILVADFGGTHARAALAQVDGAGISLSDLRAEGLAPTQTPAQWLAQYYAGLGRPPIVACAACAAGPLEQDGDDAVVHFTNRATEVRASALAAACGLERAELINDFAAVAHAIGALVDDDVVMIGAGHALAGAAQVVLGPGTGLGVAIRVPQQRGALVLPGEGGHSALAPFDAETQALWPLLAGARAQLSAEDILSGPGLKLLYSACAIESGGVPDAALLPADIAERGLSDIAQGHVADSACARAVQIFTRWLGHFAGSVALIAGARGGVYIGGGIIPAWGARFDRAGFRAAFEAQAAQRDYVKAIPSWLMQHPQPALIGLAAFARAR